MDPPKPKTAAMQFEYDPELLIAEIRKRPGIWDYSDVNYRTMAARVELWNEVVQELLQPDVKVTKTEMRELVIQLQKKWKGVKDAFVKYVQNPNRSKRPYLYSKHLQFLLKNQNTNGSGEFGGAGASSGSEDAPLAKKKKKVWKNRKQHSIVIKDEQSSEDEVQETSYSIELPPYLNDDETEKGNTKSSRTIEDFAFASVSNMDSGVEDCDKMFLLSLLPHLKSIPEEHRLNAKMELLQVLRNANHDYSGGL